MAYGFPTYPPLQQSQKIEVVTNKKSKVKYVIYVLLIVVAIFGLNAYKPQILNAYNLAVNNTQTAFQPITQTLSQQGAQQYYNIWASPTAPEPNKFTLTFQTPASLTPFSIAAGLTIKADSDLTLKPQCFLDGQAITTDPTDMFIPKSDSDQSRSITCSNSASGKQLDIKIDNPASIKTIANMWVGSSNETKNLGVLKSKQAQASAYSLSLSTLDNIPFNATKSYPLQVAIKRSRSTSTLQSISSLKLSTLSNSYHIECPFGNELSMDRASLLKSVYFNSNNVASDEFDITCQIVVTQIPDSGAEESFIITDMSYVSQEEFKTSLSNIV